jgi:hypothetical protein
MDITYTSMNVLDDQFVSCRRRGRKNAHPRKLIAEYVNDLICEVADNILRPKSVPKSASISVPNNVTKSVPNNFPKNEQSNVIPKNEQSNIQNSVRKNTPQSHKYTVQKDQQNEPEIVSRVLNFAHNSKVNISSENASLKAARKSVSTTSISTNSEPRETYSCDVLRRSSSDSNNNIPCEWERDVHKITKQERMFLQKKRKLPIEDDEEDNN